jgi:hypothetical protein
MIAHSEWKHGRVFDGISQSGHEIVYPDGEPEA